MASLDQSLTPIPRRLTEALKRAGLSQKGLGTLCGIDPSVASSRVNHYCVGRHTPNYQLLERFAKALNLPVAYFYCEDDAMAALIAILDSLPCAARSKVSKLAESLGSAGDSKRDARVLANQRKKA